MYCIYINLDHIEPRLQSRDAMRMMNCPVLQLFSLSGEQPEQLTLAHYSIAVCKALFHKYCWYIKHVVIITNSTLWDHWGMLLIWQNTTIRVLGAWIKISYVLCSKTYGTFGCLFWSPGGSRQAAGSTRICGTGLLQIERPLSGHFLYVKNHYMTVWCLMPGDKALHTATGIYRCLPNTIT